MYEQADLSSPATRREALRSVDVDHPHPSHSMLREIFDRERVWRESPDDGIDDEFENIYLAAFLLFVIGDPADSLRLYAAKFRTGDMDLGLGFDGQAIFGAGRSETLRWLLGNGHAEEHARLSKWLSRNHDGDIDDWAKGKREYFYSADGELLLDAL